jgi:hypothetical protein
MFPEITKVCNKTHENSLTLIVEEKKFRQRRCQKWKAMSLYGYPKSFYHQPAVNNLLVNLPYKQFDALIFINQPNDIAIDDIGLAKLFT